MYDVSCDKICFLEIKYLITSTIYKLKMHFVLSMVIVTALIPLDARYVLGMIYHGDEIG